MFVFRSIKPGTKFKSSTFREGCRAAAGKMENKILADAKKTVKTWTEPSEFQTEVSVGRAAAAVAGKSRKKDQTGVSLEVWTEDKIWGYLDEGTRVRYATMSKDFRAKTRVNVINSYKGRGRMLFVNRHRPRPGIKARNWSKELHKKWQPLFREAMKQALAQGAKECGHSIR